MNLNDKLHVYWSKRESDTMFYSPLGFCTTPDARYMSGVLSREVLEELDKRGYDTTTIKFSIQPKAGNVRFASERPEGMSSDDAWEKLMEAKGVGANA
jgi:hypothetical protein